MGVIDNKEGPPHYRFTLQFKVMDKASARVGMLLDACGRYEKSSIVVSAVNEYLDRHPEVEKTYEKNIKRKKAQRESAE
jgi:rRNA processing protein Gar1